MLPTRLLQAREGQIADRHILGVHDLPAHELLHGLGQVPLSCVQVIHSHSTAPMPA
jgi:hypothetical protein